MKKNISRKIELNIYLFFNTYIMNVSIKQPSDFRKNIVDKLNLFLGSHEFSVNMEKAIYNFSIKEGKSRKIIKKWDNKYFVNIYMSKLWTIFCNLKNEEI